MVNSTPNKRRWRELAKYAFSRSKPSTVGKVATDKAANVASNGQAVAELVKQLDAKDLSILQLLALNSLELATPASDILAKNANSSNSSSTNSLNNTSSATAQAIKSLPVPNLAPTRWIQCSGHEGAFAPAAPGTIWKKAASGCDNEQRAYDALMTDVMRDQVPAYYGDICYKDEAFIEMEDLLHKFSGECSVMDVKMGTRTFLESEASNAKPRSDLYEKMVKIDPSAPNAEEHAAKAITKLRYMQFRETLSSSSNLGFRIEGARVSVL